MLSKKWLVGSLVAVMVGASCVRQSVAVAEEPVVEPIPTAGMTVEATVEATVEVSPDEFDYAQRIRELERLNADLKFDLQAQKREANRLNEELEAIIETQLRRVEELRAELAAVPDIEQLQRIEVRLKLWVEFFNFFLQPFPEGCADMVAALEEARDLGNGINESLGLHGDRVVQSMDAICAFLAGDESAETAATADEFTPRFQSWFITGLVLFVGEYECVFGFKLDDCPSGTVYP